MLVKYHKLEVLAREATYSFPYSYSVKGLKIQFGSKYSLIAKLSLD